MNMQFTYVNLIVSTTNIVCKHIRESVVQLDSFIHSFHAHVQNAVIPCRSQESLPFLSVMLDASIKVRNFLCVLNFNQWWVNPLFIKALWLVSFVPKPTSFRNKEFLSGMQVLYMINLEGFVLVSDVANLLKALLICVFAHYSTKLQYT
jgi:hypothetical protein